MKAILNATLILRDHLIPDGYLLIDQGKIAGFGEMRAFAAFDGCECINAEGLFVGPGLVDIHSHAGGDAEFVKDPVSAAQYHLRHGTTSINPALYFKFDAERYLREIAKLREAMRDPRCANITGIYMEGPYLNPKFGAERESNPWKGRIDRAVYLPIIEAAKELACVWALAPEREGILEYVRDVKAVNPNAVFSVAHSEATPQEVEALIPYGLRIGTHHTNATGTLNRYPECRGVCVDEAVNANREIYAELICDSRGIHVDPYMLRLVRRIKGDDRIILISDATTARGPIPEGYEGVTDINFDHTGEIAGSRLTLNAACRNMMVHTGASLVDVFNFAAYNPSCVTGLRDRGEIAVGKRADLVLCDYKMNVHGVYLNGTEVK